MNNQLLDVARIVDRNAETTKRIFGEHANFINKHEAYINKEITNRMIDAQKELLSHLLEKNSIYNQAIMAGGYAGYFAFWSFLSDKTTPFLIALSGFFMTLSLGVFICHTVWSSMSTNKMMMNWAKTLLEYKDNPSALIAAKEKAEQNIKDIIISHAEYNSIGFIGAIFPAFLSVSILLYGYIGYLLQMK